MNPADYMQHTLNVIDEMFSPLQDYDFGDPQEVEEYEESFADKKEEYEFNKNNNFDEIPF